MSDATPDREMTEAEESLADLIDTAVPSDIPGFRYRHALHAARRIFSAGYVSPKEAKARVAAARREALLEAADDFAHLLHPYEGGVTSWLTARAEEIA